MAYGAIAGYGEGEVPPAHIDQAPLIVCAIMLAFAYIAIILRLYTRLLLVYAFGWDDILMCLALASFTVYAGGEITVSLKRTLLDHMSLSTLRSTIEAYILHLIFYAVTIVFLKLSIGVFLLRIANVKIHKRVLWGVMIISTVWGLVTALVVVFQCGYPKSINYYIYRRVQGTCIPSSVALGIGYSWAAVTASTDIALTALPLFILRDAQINRRARIVLSVLLTMGALGSIASLVRFAYVDELKTIDNRFFLHSMKLGIWSSLECGLGISAASLATLRPMFKKLLRGAQTIGVRTKETFQNGLSGSGSGRRNTIKMTESQSRSFVNRFSLSSKRMTKSTKRLSDIEDLNEYPSTPNKPFADSGTLGTVNETYSYEMDDHTVGGGGSSPAPRASKQPHHGSRNSTTSQDWLREGHMSKDNSWNQTQPI